MSDIIKIALGLGVLGLVLNAIARLWLRRSTRRLMNPSAPLRISPTITLVPLADTSPWRHARSPELVAEFTSLGYVPAGRFAVPEIAGMELLLATHADGTAVAVYDHVQVPSFFDAVKTATNDHATYVTTSPLHDPRHTPPTAVAIWDPQLTPRQAIDTLRDAALDGELLPATNDNVKQIVIDAYERQMAHIVAGPTTTAADVRETNKRWAAASGVRTAPTAVELENAVAAVHDWERDRTLTAMLAREFIQAGACSQHEWEHEQDRFVVIHERMSDDQRAAVLSGDVVASPVATVDHPVRATLYRRRS